MTRFFLFAACLAVLCVGCSGGATSEAQDEKPVSQSGEGATPKPDEGTSGGAEAAAGGGESSFAEVAAIFNESCVKCHSGPGAKGAIDLSTYDGVMKGGEDGAIVTAGDVEKSKLSMALRGKGAKQMPMMAEPLPEEKIAKVEAWIKAGAKKE
ncbi:MAG: c-type cytochrome [Armatimonadetes bacterium]|nr:c-type cytochrome [Armatimonadota bacterium]